MIPVVHTRHVCCVYDYNMHVLVWVFKNLVVIRLAVFYTPCRRYVTADAMGMAKERGRLEDELCRWCRNRVEYKNSEGHHDVPRFGALQRENTPTLACLLCINEITNYNKCSWSCIGGRRDRPWAWLSPASLLVVMASSK